MIFVEININMTYDDYIKLDRYVTERIEFDGSNIKSKISEVPKLYMDISRILFKERKLLVELESKSKACYSKKLTQYKFGTHERYESVAEITKMIEGDEEYRQIDDDYECQKVMVDQLDKMLKSISQLSFIHKNFIDQENYEAGNYR